MADATPSGAAADSSVLSKYRRVWAQLPPRLRASAAVLMLGNVAGAALEVAGLALLTALMSAITPGASGTASPWMQALLRALDPGDPVQQALRLVAACAAVFALKNIFMAALAWLEASFAFHLQAFLSDRVLHNLLVQDYEQAARRSPAVQLNLMTSEMQTLVFAVALPTLTFVSELLLMLAVVGFLFWAEPTLTAAVVGIVGIAVAVLMRASRRAVGTLGRQRQRIEDERTRRLREVVDHLREVHVYRAAQEARRRLRTNGDELARILRAFQMLSTGPRFVLELVLVGVLLGAVLIGLQGATRHALIVSVGVFAASGFRLLIGANRLIMSAQGIRFGQFAFARILGDLEAVGRDGPATAALPLPATLQPAPRALALAGASYGYPGGPPLLQGLDLALAPGEMVGIRGGSGMGKTTLLELFAGLRQASAGHLLLDGRPVADPARDIFPAVGYLGQSPAVFSDSVRRNVAYGCADEAIDDARVWSALARAHLEAHVRTLPGGLDAEIGRDGVQFSGGQAQRLALARALYAGRRFLLLDEPTSALDGPTEADVIATLVELSRECGLLLVSHRPAPLQACTRVYELQQGRLQPVGLADLRP
ncbi:MULTISPECIES: ABC transporter ATP-binding protein [Ramlibacter]|uniref:ABC transporter ATP-binding protein n=1 Tax=Ramlibacter aquaticus TaxID=2780094 RepID=A0ABR9SAP5_9BURK|nr:MULTISPECIES: ABC transporter ATP-binding protein [Ramlibacter]MBE7939429.1 ABC transporter ATP-binding protein [Ramlibacter aquaticus]